MKEITIEQVNNGFVVRVYDYPLTDEKNIYRNLEELIAKLKEEWGGEK